MNQTLDYAKELIHQVRELSPKGEMVSLIDDLERFIQVQQELTESPESAELQEKAAAFREKLWGSFEKLTESMEMTPESVREYFEAQGNFSENDWKQVQEPKALKAK